MSITGPLLFIALIALSVGTPLAMAIGENLSEYSNEKSAARREAIASQTFALAVPAALVVAVLALVAFVLA